MCRQMPRMFQGEFYKSCHGSANQSFSPAHQPASCLVTVFVNSDSLKWDVCCGSRSRDILNPMLFPSSMLGLVVVTSKNRSIPGSQSSRCQEQWKSHAMVRLCFVWTASCGMMLTPESPAYRSVWHSTMDTIVDAIIGFSRLISFSKCST